MGGSATTIVYMEVPKARRGLIEMAKRKDAAGGTARGALTARDEAMPDGSIDVNGHTAGHPHLLVPPTAPTTAGGSAESTVAATTDVPDVRGVATAATTPPPLHPRAKAAAGSTNAAADTTATQTADRGRPGALRTGSSRARSRRLLPPRNPAPSQTASTEAPASSMRLTVGRRHLSGNPTRSRPFRVRRRGSGRPPRRLGLHHPRLCEVMTPKRRFNL